MKLTVEINIEPHMSEQDVSTVLNALPPVVCRQHSGHPKQGVITFNGRYVGEYQVWIEPLDRPVSAVRSRG